MMILLPCPHCRKSFRFESEQLAGGSYRLRCPSCSGEFILRTAATGERQAQKVGPLESGPLEGGNADAGGSEPPPSEVHTSPQPDREERASAPHMQDVSTSTTRPDGSDEGTAYRKRRPSLLILSLIILIPVGSMLLTLGIIKRNRVPEGSATATRLSQSSIQATAGHPHGLAPSQDQAYEGPQQRPSKAFPFFPLDEGDPCQRMTALQKEILDKGDDRLHAEVFTLWTAYLVTQTLAPKVCPLEQVFDLASEGIRTHSLCGTGYTFLSAYYLAKRVEDRAKTSLDEAYRRMPEDPWVYLVDAQFSRVIDQDPKAGIQRLRQGLSHAPDHLYVHYALAILYLETEAYQEAADEFAWLERRVGQADAFQDLMALSQKLKGMPPGSNEGTSILLAVARNLVPLKEYLSAETLYRKALENGAEGLPEEEGKIAFYELGQIYEQRGNARKAYASYQNALRMDPRFTAARVRMEALVLPQQSSENTVGVRLSASSTLAEAIH